MSAAGFSERLPLRPPFLLALLQGMLRKAGPNLVEAPVEGWVMPWLSSGESRTSSPSRAIGAKVSVWLLSTATVRSSPGGRTAPRQASSVPWSGAKTLCRRGRPGSSIPLGALFRHHGLEAHGQADPIQDRRRHGWPDLGAHFERVGARYPPDLIERPYTVLPVTPLTGRLDCAPALQAISTPDCTVKGSITSARGAQTRW